MKYLLFVILFSCAPIPPVKKEIVKRKTLPLSITLNKEVSRLLIQQPDQVLEVEVYSLKGKRDVLITSQAVSNVKVPVVIRLKVLEDKAIKRPTYTVKVRLLVDKKNSFKGFLIVPYWRSLGRPIPLLLRRE